MTPRTAKRRVKWDAVVEELYIADRLRGWIERNGKVGQDEWEWIATNAKGNAGTAKTKRAARRSLLKAVREKKEKRK